MVRPRGKVLAPSIRYEKVSEVVVANAQDPGNLSGAALAWENMKAASEARYCIVFGLAAVAWLKATPGADFLVLEKRLRAEHLETRILAIRVPDDLNEMDFRHPLGMAVDKSACRMAIYCCGPEDFARQEFEKEGTNYAENLSRLSNVLVQKHFFQEASIEKVEGVQGKVLRNTHLLNIARTEAVTYYDDTIRKHAEMSGQTPEIRLVGTTQTGLPMLQTLFKQGTSWEPLFDLVESMESGPMGDAPSNFRRCIMRIHQN